MGKIKKGILGGFSGRVGNVIGGSWKGIDYMRSEATSIADPKTAKQLEQRSKFRVAVEFAKQVVPLINIGLKQYATKRSEFNYLVSRICKDWWDDANDNINYPLVQLSAGELPDETISNVLFEVGSSDVNVSVQWDMSNPEFGSNYSAVCLVDLDDGNCYFHYNSEDLTRDNEASNLTLPLTASRNNYCVYLFFYDPQTMQCSATTFYKP